MKVHPETHIDMTMVLDNSIDSRGILDFPGRIFVRQQILTFWTFPKPDELKDIIKDLEDILDITIDDDWLIEIDIKDDIYKKPNNLYNELLIK